ncbi:hypothetical protein D7X30_39080 [Corallococcus sp. AB011P]|uniref:hypothetical protein n=1 Tax=Corallococcus sp. AB011P TaxID=2316735 RepID=UPI000EA34573|nr:hypothetical protein [Corallococcus sp. AB011P]RKG49779.1 hypothetical protein D7X30_39080 [Corallococcus sp. AB011P]
MAGMSVSLMVSFGLGWLLAASPSQAGRIVPCTPDSADWKAAQEELSAFDARMEALLEDGEGEEARTGLQLLLGHRCFSIAREEETREPLTWDEEHRVPALALKTWWRDGGKAYFASQLELGRPGAHTVVIAPDLRDVLSRETSPKHRLAPLLCPTKAGTCGAETEAWRVRAEQTALLPRNRRYRDSGDRAAPRPDCAAVARKRPLRGRYKAWRECMGDSEGARPLQSALPLGRIRAPMDGWLVVRGRRGHYTFCDQVDAFHLATGTTYRSSSCSKLRIAYRGNVDTAETDAARKAQVTVGRVAPERLRELTWMMLMEPEVRDGVQMAALRVPVPKGIPIEWPAKNDDRGRGGLSGAGAWNSGQTLLGWTWLPPANEEPWSGEFTFPMTYELGEDHINVLLEETEATFQEGCPAVPPPVALLDHTREPGVSDVDAPEGVGHEQDARVMALRTWSPPPGCTPGRDGG